MRLKSFFMTIKNFEILRFYKFITNYEKKDDASPPAFSSTAFVTSSSCCVCAPKHKMIMRKRSARSDFGGGFF